VLVQRVLIPVGGRESWTLLGDDGEMVEPAERYLACLAAIERSPNTVRAYAISLKLWFEFLQRTAESWDEAGVEDVARFVGWLRAPAGHVIVLAGGSGARGPGHRGERSPEDDGCDNQGGGGEAGGGHERQVVSAGLSRDLGESVTPKLVVTGGGRHRQHGQDDRATNPANWC
jgi:hypothetical protein